MVRAVADITFGAVKHTQPLIAFEDYPFAPARPVLPPCRPRITPECGRKDAPKLSLQPFHLLHGFHEPLFRRFNLIRGQLVRRLRHDSFLRPQSMPCAARIAVFYADFLREATEETQGMEEE